MVKTLTQSVLGGGQWVVRSAYAGVRHVAWYIAYQAEGTAHEDEDDR